VLNDSNIKAVFFDADDTLITIKDSIGIHYLKVFNKYGFDYPISGLNIIIKNTWFNNRNKYLNAENDYQTSIEQEKDFWINFVKEVCQSCNINYSNQLLEEVYFEFSKAETRNPMPDAINVLEYLKNNNYKIGIISNHDLRLKNVLSELGLYEYFDYFFVSATLGYKKPSEKVFSKVLELTNFNKDQIVYIGNSYDLDYLGAKNAGWKALLLGDNNQVDLKHRILKLGSLITLE
jgi:putative hydrolase of the HAD superfamily